jgi:hypothetical protein
MANTPRDELRGLLLRRRKTHQPETLRAVLDERDQAQRFVLATHVSVLDIEVRAFDDGSQRWLDAHHEVFALTDQFQLRLRFAEFDELLRRVLQDDARMTHQGDDRRWQIDAIAVAVTALGAQRARHLGIPRWQMFVAEDFHEAQRAWSAPAALTALLFERFDPEQLTLLADLDGPEQACRFTAGVGSSLLAAERLQGVENRAPLLASTRQQR